MHAGLVGERYPERLRALAGVSGVYVIRDHVTRAVLYVGESHSGRLYGTITRHFQSWSRGGSAFKRLLWERAGFSRSDPGIIYARHGCDVRAIVTSAENAPKLQAQLINRLRPRDNRYLLDAAPF
jgi:excinuclease UvrABC nuclease subunit